MIEIVNKDLFDQVSTSSAICIPTNCSIVEGVVNPMSGGVAGLAAARWPELPKIYGKLLRMVPNVPVILGFVNKADITKFMAIDDQEIDHEEWCAIVAFPTMHEIGHPADLDLISLSCCLIEELADHFAWERVCMAAPGIGIGGLSWDNEVKPLLEEINLDDRFEVMRLEEKKIDIKNFMLN